MPGSGWRGTETEVFKVRVPETYCLQIYTTEYISECTVNNIACRLFIPLYVCGMYISLFLVPTIIKCSTKGWVFQMAKP